MMNKLILVVIMNHNVVVLLGVFVLHEYSYHLDLLSGCHHEPQCGGVAWGVCTT
jgi:hypothetical protein